MRLPFYKKAAHPRFELAPGRSTHMMEIIDFLKWVINQDKLEIATYFEEMDQEPFFLVAATGLGKTVGVPIHMLIRQIQRLGRRPNPQPRVWIVEPRIPIAIGQADFMNSLWRKYSVKNGKKSVPPLFGCVSSTSGSVNPDALVQFVTTGIFELMAKDGRLTSDRDRVIVDEAHVTIEQNSGVELAIALAKQAGVVVDYMSATVDTRGLQESLGVARIINADKRRFTVWKHNLLTTAEKALPDLIAHTLVHPDTASKYYPQLHEFGEAEEICAAVTEDGRSHGMLVVVNSFAGAYSDTQRLARIIREAHPDLPVLQLASEVIRNPKRMRNYEESLRRIEAAQQNYVILATSVVEMGITFPTLDYVLTMDSAYEQEAIGDVTFPVVSPIGVNSLLQRIGRVGRKRPGIAYISCEVGAEFAELEDEELNKAKSLAYGPITFPLSGASLMPLAYYGYKQGWSDLSERVAELHLPSAIHLDEGRMEHLREQTVVLEELGIIEGSTLTPLGESMERWMGQVNLGYAMELQRCLDDETVSIADIVFWLVVTALSNTPIVTLRAPHDFFVDRNGAHIELSHALDVWSHAWLDHEDASVFMMFSRIAELHPKVLFGSVNEYALRMFNRHCGNVGVDGRKLMKAAQAIQDVWKLFCRINGEHPRMKALFGAAAHLNFGSLPWQMFHQTFPHGDSWRALYRLVGLSSISMCFNEDLNAFEWRDVVHGHQGVISQDDTPVPLEDGDGYVAVVTPSRKTKGDALQWRLSHLGR
ncbi:MAG TPA: helicase-related protein [Candidatus Saccharimonadales bacterium]|nr:helicase-related protein [Candidatus Saccharimonadales bacterium]